MKDSHKIILGLGGVVLVYIAWYYYRSRYGNRTIWQGPRGFYKNIQPHGGPSNQSPIEGMMKGMSNWWGNSSKHWEPEGHMREIDPVE